MRPALEGQENGYLSSPQRSVWPDCDDPEFDIDDVDEYDDYSEDEDAPVARVSPPAARTLHNGPKVPAWLKELRDIASVSVRHSPGATQWPTGREVLYVIDVANSASQGHLILLLQSRERKMDGNWARPKALAPLRNQIPQLPLSQDREILSVLLGTDAFNQYQYGGSDQFRCAASAVLIPMMQQRPLFRAGSKGADSAPPFSDEDGEWNFELGAPPRNRRMRTGRLVSAREGA